MNEKLYEILSDLYKAQPKATPKAELTTPKRRKPAAGHIKGRYLKGRIPLAWLTLACSLPGKALATALAIWYLSGLRRGEKVDLKLTSVTLSQFGVDRYAKGRALKALEGAKLIKVRRTGPKKNPLVTILEVETREPEADTPGGLPIPF